MKTSLTVFAIKNADVWITGGKNGLRVSELRKKDTEWGILL